jgi:coenzyme PQQ precursor peptide PqqA
MSNGAKEGDNNMSWTAPKLLEIALGGEINCYACAKLK